MCTLTEFDPTPAIQHWMALKNRKPRQGSKAKEQEWYKGVFAEAANNIRAHSKVIKF